MIMIIPLTAPEALVCYKYIYFNVYTSRDVAASNSANGRLEIWRAGEFTVN